MKVSSKKIVITGVIILDCIFAFVLMNKFDNKSAFSTNFPNIKQSANYTIDDSLIFVNEATTDLIELSVVSQEDLQIAQEIILNEQQQVIIGQRQVSEAIENSNRQVELARQANERKIAEAKAREAARKAVEERKKRALQDAEELKKALSNEKNASQKGKAIVEYALKFNGNSYVFGGSWDGEEPYTPTDCSGFTQGLYKHFGYDIPRVARDQAIVGREVELKDIQPGDLVFYSSNGSTVTHAAIYIGNGKIIHAQTPRLGIGISNIRLGTLVRVHIRRVV